MSKDADRIADNEGEEPTGRVLDIVGSNLEGRPVRRIGASALKVLDHSLQYVGGPYHASHTSTSTDATDRLGRSSDPAPTMTVFLRTESVQSGSVTTPRPLTYFL